MTPPGGASRSGGGRESPGLAALVCAAAAVVLAGLTGGGPAPALALPEHGTAAAPIPAFSRMYGTACSTCHTAAPKLNVLGEAFRLNGYRPPETGLLRRRDDPVSLGAPEWDEAWPRAIRSSDLPGIVPLALRVVSDVQVTRDEREPYDATYRFPHELQLLAGAPLGDDVSVFLEAAWSPAEGFEVTQAKAGLQDPVPGLPDRALDVWVGLQHAYLLTFADHHIDRAARQSFAWQAFRPSEVGLALPGGGPPLRTDNDLDLGRSQPAVEVSGLIGGRLYYGAGLAQGLGDGATDRNGRKDLYYKLRYKIGGVDLAGGYEPGGEPTFPMPGQLFDRTLILEHFGYFGSESTAASPQGDHRAFGLAARTLHGPLDLGVGWVFRAFDRPWSDLGTGRLEANSLFGKAEYLFLPWVIGSMKAEWFDVAEAALPPGVSGAPPPSEATRLMPGVVLLLRQNVRLVLEGELFLDLPATDRAGLPLPHNLWTRLDVAF